MNRRLLALLLALGLPANAYLDFDGSSNYAKIDESILSASPWTVTFWYQSSATTSTTAAVYLAATGSTTPLLWISRIGSSDTSTAPCDVAGRARLKVRTADSGCDINLCVAKLVNDGSWHFVAASASSNSNFSLRVDSVTNTGTDADCLSFPGTNRTSIGARFRATADFFDDSNIADVRMYNRVLTDAELESLASSRVHLPITDGQLGYWRLDEGIDGATAQGTSVIDWSGNAKTLTATASPVFRAENWLAYP